MVTSSRASDTFSGSHASNGHNSSRGRTITATVESLKGGCLGGDNLPIKVVIYHTKHIMSMKGVIITLYRHARVDTHPEIPIGPMSAKDRRKNDDYYPKSLTGLGGLSLSGAGSSHVFRKDLSQVVVPLIVDHKTLTTEITPRLRVPDDAFPTISCVPGSMISFKYYVEVIVDIQGKLSGQERYFTPGQDTTTSSGQSPFADVDSAVTADRSGQQRFDQGIVDTAPIRRDKSVVTCVLEVIIGTRDSERAKGKGRALADTDVPSPSGPSNSRQSPGFANGNSPFGHSPRTQITSSQTSIDRVSSYLPPPAFRPPSTIRFEEGLSEKERLRRHEQSLLPSQPPGIDEDFASRAQASAPVLDHANADPLWYAGLQPDFPSGEGSSSGATLPYRAGQTENPYSIHADDSTMVHAQDPNMTSDWIAEQAPPVADKQEMERRHLESQVSEPPVAEGEASSSTIPFSFHVPTEDEVEGYGYPDDGSSQQQDHSHVNGDQDYHHLPRYQR